MHWMYIYYYGEVARLLARLCHTSYFPQKIHYAHELYILGKVFVYTNNMQQYTFMYPESSCLVYDIYMSLRNLNK